MEVLESVNLVLFTWSIIVDALMVKEFDCVLVADYIVQAVVCVVSINFGVAWIGRSLESVRVGFHDIEIWAVLTINSR